MGKILNIFKSDLQIITAIRNGDDKALAYLYEKNLRMISKFIKENSGSENDAVEILQDALVVFWEKSKKNDFRLNAKISTFIYAIVKRKWMHELARRKRFIEIEGIKHNPGMVTSEQDQDLEQKETIEIVKVCMKRLSPLCQQILTLFYFEEKSMSEICKATDLANENVAKAKKYQCKNELALLVKGILKETIEG